MHLIGLATLGRDVELRFLNDGTHVANLALAFNYGKKDQNSGDRPTQWVDAALFGERAERLQQWLTKGRQISVHLSDPHIETYQKNDGSQGFKLVARVDVIDFVRDGNRDQQQGQQQQRPQQRNSADDYQRAKQGNAPQRSGPAPRADFSDMDDDIPFIFDNTWLASHATAAPLMRARRGRKLDAAIEF